MQQDYLCARNIAEPFFLSCAFSVCFGESSGNDLVGFFQLIKHEQESLKKKVVLGSQEI